MFTSFVRFSLRSRLSLRLLVYVVICSLFFTLLSSAFQLYLGYKADILEIHKNIQFIEDSYLPSIANSVYILDEEQLKLQLKGVLQLHDIIYIEISETTDAKNALVLHLGDPKSSRDIVRVLPLVVNRKVQQKNQNLTMRERNIGTLTIVASFDDILGHLWNKAAVILMSTAIQTFLASFFILLIIQIFVTRHLITMDEYAKQLDIDTLGPNLKLNRRKRVSTKQDELDHVVNSINDLQLRLQNDIMARHEVEIALRAHEVKLLEEQKFSNALINALPDIFCVTEEGKRLIRWSQATEIKTGYSAEELYGKDFKKLFIGKDLENVENTVRNIMSGNTASTEINVINKNASKTPYLFKGTLLESDDKAYLVGVGVDISALKTAEQELRLAKFSIDNNSNPVFWVGQDGHFIYANKAARLISGYSHQEFMNLQLSDLSPYFSQNALTHHTKASPKKPTQAFENSLLTKDKQSIPVEITINIDEFEGEKYVFVHMQNITKRKQAEDQLAKYHEHLEELVAERTFELEKEIMDRKEIEKALKESRRKAEAANLAKSEFLANMSHELRSPLNVILGYSQLLYREKKINHEQKDQLDIINQSGKHLLSLINDVLEMSKIEAGQKKLTIKEFDLFFLLDSLENSFGLRAVKKGLDLSFARADNVPQFIRIDDGILRQILINLLSNAIKFVEEGEIQVKIDAATEKGKELYLSFQVKDTGLGIKHDELTHIFDPFEQAEAGRNKEEGTGLGLAISQQFAQLLGGEITVISNAGKGSVFTLKIPVEIAAADLVPKANINRHIIGLRSGQENNRILIVEDHHQSRKLLSNLLQIIGFEVTEAANGREGVERFHSWQPDIIIMDMRMPEMDGYEATRRIKNSGGKETPIIALTASAFMEDREQILSAGCDDLIIKPFEESDVFYTIGKYLKIDYIYNSNIEDLALGEEKLWVETKLTKKLFADVPRKLLKEIRNITLDCNKKNMESLTKRIRTSGFNKLADILEQLAQQFQFDKILNIIDSL
jgi:PAS domain S-box-containing protein